MAKLVTFILFLVSTISVGQANKTFMDSTTLNDSDNKSQCFIVKSNVLELSLNAFKVNCGSLTLEKGFKSRHSIQLTGTYRNYFNIESYTWLIIPEYKYYLKLKHNFKGFYSGAYCKYESQSYINKYESPNGSNYGYLIKDLYIGKGGGVIFGYQTYLKKRFTIDFLVGIGVKYITKKNVQSTNIIIYDTNSDYPRTDIDGRLAINLGYKF